MLLWTLAATSAECAVYPQGLGPRFFLTCRIAVRAGGAWPGPDAPGGEMPATAATNGRFGHLAFFYHGRGEYLAALCAFIRAGRARGEAVFVAVPECNTQRMRQELGADSAHQMLVDMAELGRNPARIIPAVLAYAGKHRGQRVCFIGEPIWPGRTEAELQEAIRHEALINLAFRGSLVTFLCAYDSTGLPGSVIADAASTHPAVIKDRQEIASAGYLAGGPSAAV
jgi:MEDS: MEthanogen/methylotroph, DcmR Sensory domain